MSKAKILITRKWPEGVEAELMKHYDVQCNDSDVAMTVNELRAALGEYDAILPTVTDNMGAAVFETDTIRTKAICNDKRIEEISHRLSSVLELVDQLQAADTNSLVDSQNSQQEIQRLREDKVTETNQREAFQAIAPDTEDGLYLVPKVID
jgi:aspartyl-tRNA(Asn)/glutamyl-tRNA(Gln) amidotransferase subunit C